MLRLPPPLLHSALGGSASDIAGVNDDNIASDEAGFLTAINANPIINISVSKVLNTTGPFVAGQTVSYVIDVNNGSTTTPATNVIITDTPTNLSIQSVSGGGCTGFPFTIASIAAKTTESISVTATISSAGSFDNSVIVRADEADPNTTNNEDITGNGGTATVPTFIQETDGAWNVASNWSDNLVPGINDDAIIDAGVASFLTQDQAVNNLELRPGSTVSIPNSGVSTDPYILNLVGEL